MHHARERHVTVGGMQRRAGRQGGRGIRLRRSAESLVAVVLIASLVLAACGGGESSEAEGRGADDSDVTSSMTVPPASAQVGDEMSTATFDIPPKVAAAVTDFPAGAYVPMGLEIERIERGEAMELDDAVFRAGWNIEGTMPGAVELEDVYAQVEDAYAPTLPVDKTVGGRSFLIEGHLVHYTAFRDDDGSMLLWVGLRPLESRPTGS